MFMESLSVTAIFAKNSTNTIDGITFSIVIQRLIGTGPSIVTTGRGSGRQQLGLQPNPTLTVTNYCHSL